MLLSTTKAVLLLIIGLIVSLQVGGSEVGWLDLLNLFSCWWTGQQADQVTEAILLTIRLPRTIVAALCGGSLAAAGVISQGLFRNVLASPAILGTSSGGSFCAVLAFFFSASVYHWYSVPLAAFAGAVVVTSLLIVIADQGIGGSRLLLVGFAINTFFGALTSLLIFLLIEEQYKIASVLHWLFGGFDGRSWQHLQLLVGPVVIGLIICRLVTNRLDTLFLGEGVAQSLGVNLRQLNCLAISAIALLVGSTVAVAGTLPFIGLMIPHVCRLIYGACHRRLLVFSFIHGMSFTLLIDIVARLLGGGREIDVGIMTTLIGGPFFLGVLLWQKTSCN